MNFFLLLNKNKKTVFFFLFFRYNYLVNNMNEKGGHV